MGVTARRTITAIVGLRIEQADRNPGGGFRLTLIGPAGKRRYVLVDTITDDDGAEFKATPAQRRGAVDSVVRAIRLSRQDPHGDAGRIARAAIARAKKLQR